jgi:hypothetical protein
MSYMKNFLLTLFMVSAISLTGCGEDEAPDDGEDLEEVEEDEIGD